MSLNDKRLGESDLHETVSGEVSVSISWGGAEASSAKDSEYFGSE
jgi:hypothetical protein